MEIRKEVALILLCIPSICYVQSFGLHFLHVFWFTYKTKNEKELDVKLFTRAEKWGKKISVFVSICQK